MNKEWFIFKGTHHLGPFSLKEMEDFFHTGEINAQTLVWKEGAEKWESMSRTPELDFILNGTVAPKKPEIPPPVFPPPLPDLPEDEAPPSIPSFLGTSPSATKAAAKAVNDEEDLPPPIPLDALLNKSPPAPESPLKKYVPRILFSAVAAVLVLTVGWFVSQEFGTPTTLKIKGIMPVYLERLQETAALTTPSTMVTMALSLDGKTLWVSTNKSGEIRSVIKMKSIPKRILGNENVSLTVKGVIRDHLGKFEKMQLTEGKQFVPGEYRIEFTGKKIHFLNNNFRSLSNIPWLKKLDSTYKFSGDALIYAGTPREFEKKLIDYRETLLNEKLKPFHDKLERLQTFSSLLNKTAENYLLVMDKMKTGKEIAAFEKTYMKEISPIIQSLVVAADEISRDKNFQEEDFRNPIAPYKEQILLGKQIGELASDMITETGKFKKKITEKEKSQLRFRFENRYRSIKLQLEINIKKLQAHITKLSQ